MKVVLNRLQDGSYHVSPARPSGVLSKKSVEPSTSGKGFAGQKRAATATTGTNDRFEKQIVILNVIPGSSTGIDLYNSLTFKWQTIGQCNDCLLCRSAHRTIINHETYYMSPSMRSLVRRIVELEQNSQVLMYPLIVGPPSTVSNQ